jgi:chemotaxis protein methyltransferase CheR
VTGISSLQELERFRAAITQRLGLSFDDGKLAFLGEILQRRLSKLNYPSEIYLSALEQDTSRDEAESLAQELTVTETYFFRNNEQFRALAEVVLPARMRRECKPRILSFLSAGCASGEEAYSIAMTAQEAIADRSWELRIDAVDINQTALEKARRGRYSAWAVRGMQPDTQRRWFQESGKDLILDEGVRSAVKFKTRNLSVDDPDLWRPASYDVIFCRNVLMYFTPERMQAAINRIARSLAPGGFLFLGHAETLRGLSHQFHLRHTHETFYYQLKDGAEIERTADLRPGPTYPGVGAFPIATPAMPPRDAWVEEIRQASERIAALIPGQAAAVAVSRQPQLSPAWDLSQALDLLHKERFSDALTSLRTLPTESSNDPDVLLLEAMLLTHDGQAAAAEKTCRRLLAIDELNAGAHYILALCKEAMGERGEAIEHDRVAIYLDAAFAMPRLHLGLLARRANDRDAARRELGQALILLKREDTSRILLFGGGFNREALIALCESALRESGGRS